MGALPVNVRFAEEVPLFNQAVMRLPIGQPVQLTVRRNGAEKTLTVTTIERESVEAPVSEVPLAGITASNLTTWSAKELKRANRQGVRVRGLRAGGPADEAKPALRKDDVIVEVDGTPTPTLAALDGVLQQATKDKEDRHSAARRVRARRSAPADRDRRRATPVSKIPGWRRAKPGCL